MNRRVAGSHQSNQNLSKDVKNFVGWLRFEAFDSNKIIIIIIPLARVAYEIIIANEARMAIYHLISNARS